MTPSTHWCYCRFSIASPAPLLMNILTLGLARKGGGRAKILNEFAIG